MFDTLIVQPIFNLLIGLYSIIPGGDFGISLILFTILVRLALWPLVKKQLHQVKAMRKIQPELAKIKKQAKGNRQLEGMQMLELYKKHNVKPFRSILILLIQLPIFIALYRVIQIFTLHRDEVESYTYGFMQGLEPIRQIIESPSQFNEHLFGIVDLTQHAIGSGGISITLFLLAIVSAITQYIMSKQTTPSTEPSRRMRDVLAEAAEGKQHDQSEMNAIVMSKMIKVMPIFMFFIMLNLPGALVLYYTVSNLVAVAQQHLILKQDTEEMEKLAEAAVKKQGAGKKATAKARAKQAEEAKVTRITAKDTKKKG